MDNIKPHKYLHHHAWQCKANLMCAMHMQQPPYQTYL